ncbi:MAG: hypothetical protein AAFP83_14625, partial [Bacteroidota bacterium]
SNEKNLGEGFHSPLWPKLQDDEDYCRLGGMSQASFSNYCLSWSVNFLSFIIGELEEVGFN